MKTVRVAGQPSWQLRSSTVEAWLTRRGGHLAPVVFRVKGKNVQPYFLPPWAEEKVPANTSAVIRVLRGDFFCLPFGREGTPRFRGETHAMHGETANALWTHPSCKRVGDRVTLRARVALKFRAGRVDKELTVRDGHSVVYNRHLISGLKGPITFAHHPNLQFPASAEPALIATSEIQFGQVFPRQTLDQSKLKSGAFFSTLSRVPLRTGGRTDLSRYPLGTRCDDMVQVANRPSGPFAWTAVTVPSEGYVWFTLKDPSVLPSTLFWISNGGVDDPPLNGRVRGVLGVEDFCGYFAGGVAGSVARNAFSARGVVTSTTLSTNDVLDVRTITGVVAVPKTFGKVARILPGAGSITLVSTRGKKVRCAVDHEFLA
ncbi:MAG: hypothetical protein JWM32_1038 [Verrucomicrobia bacterium]|nr:hypothetical protein [Verrucomicrobiota bacterium]